MPPMPRHRSLAVRSGLRASTSQATPIAGSPFELTSASSHRSLVRNRRFNADSRSAPDAAIEVTTRKNAPADRFRRREER
jgi:hypothetical protein